MLLLLLLLLASPHGTTKTDRTLSNPSRQTRIIGIRACVRCWRLLWLARVAHCHRAATRACAFAAPLRVCVCYTPQKTI